MSIKSFDSTVFGSVENVLNFAHTISFKVHRERQFHLFAYPGTQVIAVSTKSGDGCVRNAISAGARALLFKSKLTTELIPAATKASLFTPIGIADERSHVEFSSHGPRLVQPLISGEIPNGHT